MKMFPNAILYANEGSEGKKYVKIFSHEDMARLFSAMEWWRKGEVYKVSYDPTLDYWREFNQKVIAEMKQRIQPGDIILNIGGSVQKLISDAFPDNITCEFGVGYEGVFSNHRVFESYAWMHTMYGYLYGASRADGRFFDAVIPNYFDVKDFPFSVKKEKYLLFMSRPIDRKGLAIVREIAKRTGIKVKVAGKEKVYGENIEWVGYADTKTRGKLMAKATALLCPTLYVGPFEGVNVEAQLCGTPVITTDWGAFQETVEQGKTGFRCRMLKEFLEATEKVKDLDPNYIKQRAVLMYSLEAVKPMYQKFFDQLSTLHKDGWYTV